MDFSKGAIVTRGKGKPKSVHAKTRKNRKGIKAIVVLANKEELDSGVTGEFVSFDDAKLTKLDWIVVTDKTEEEYPITKESLLIPFGKLVNLYCIPYTNPSHDEWLVKKDKDLKISRKDKHRQMVVGLYWSTVRPNLVVYGEINEDKEFVINF